MIQAGMLAGLSASAAQLSSETYDDVWKFAEWYENDESGFVRSVRFSGRFQYEFAAVDADEGSHEEWNVRRMRLGVKSALFGHLTVHVEAEFNPQERDPFYARFTDLYVEWSRNDWLALTVGKQSVGFTMDGQTSSKELLTIDRSNLANNLWFPDEYIPGASASGQVLNWVYGVGAYSAGEANRELGRFSGSVFGLLSLGYDFSESLGVEDALLRGNYVYQNADNDNTFTRPFRHVASGNFQFAGGRWGFRADVASGAGYLGQSDLLGVTTMPYFDITPKLQLVGRHTWLASEAPNGVRLARYESQAVSGRGDRYNELYLGVNYYFYGHKLKLQSGVQWADMDDLAGDGGAYSGVSSTTGLRVSW
jgi:phosphate-selective porin OprO/OprP